MAFLTIPQVQDIKEHMIDGDERRLAIKYKSKKTSYDLISVELNEVEEYEKLGWELATRLKRTAKMQKQKECGRQFEDDMWCLFHNLGFTTINIDENLVVPWGPNHSDHKQLDVVAVGDEAIFVVECKATNKRKNGNFKNDIDNFERYKDGITKSLRQIYGDDKRVKFIFATRGYTFPEGSEDLKRLTNKKIYHFNENTYNYINSLIKSYKSSVIYQFYGLMFKGERISTEPIRVPALKGTMGGHDYYMLSIEPEKLLKIGFVLHRTRVNDSMATPTYQRMLVPSRLKGITKFIDNGGYFPNTIIVNFDNEIKKLRVQFEQSGKSCDSQSRFGYLLIPNAYGMAYIIDGQHRVYGYAGSKYKAVNTIPCVAFSELESDEQLRIFMDINENQKAVSPSLRLDLEEDLNWDSSRIDSRLKALRSSIIKNLSRDTNSPLYGKISIGEDIAKLTFPPFDNALQKTSLLPKATQKSYTQNQDVCLYDCNTQDYEKAMNEAKKRISYIIRDSYNYVRQMLDEDIYNTYIECNRGTFGFIGLIGSLNEFKIKIGELSKASNTIEQIEALKPYLNVFCNYLCNMPEDDKNALLGIKGQGADTRWLRMFQDSINKEFPDFEPEGLDVWKETQDQSIQDEGKTIGMQIESILQKRILEKLEDLYGSVWEKSIMGIKGKCLQRMDDNNADDSSEEWTDYMEPLDYKEIIEKEWQSTKSDNELFVTFELEFTIQLEDGVYYKTKRDKLKWLNDFISMQKSWTKTKGKSLTRAQVDELTIILQSLRPSE
jgi:DNA sulfur modification protein DndB